RRNRHSSTQKLMTTGTIAPRKARRDLIQKRRDYLDWLQEDRFLDYPRFNTLFKKKYRVEIVPRTYPLQMTKLMAGRNVRRVERDRMSHPVYYLWREGLRAVGEEDERFVHEKSRINLTHDLLVTDIHLAVAETAARHGAELSLWEQRMGRLKDWPRDEYGNY